MTETLTAEERAYALQRGVHFPEDVPLFAKLVRLYDAALAERDTALARVPLAQKCDNYRTALDAWNDEITARIKAQGELSTALARIAELDEQGGRWRDLATTRAARIAELEADRVAIDLHSRGLIDSLAALRTRIARAVAELEKFFAVNETQQIDPQGIEHIERAREALR